jgi:hypothetical protein
VNAGMAHACYGETLLFAKLCKYSKTSQILILVMALSLDAFVKLEQFQLRKPIMILGAA